ncbi:hypothetical protein SUDANB121_04281 [Nocardiopsis dassonvillei]|uniref:hypothetical protein n=1 Tax=Nocardiopsis dassonvillei TaxID=2014 RepID=UPI003F55DAF7
MNNETLERLRLPVAWVLIGAAGASVLSGLIWIISESGFRGRGFPSGMVDAGSGFYGLQVVVPLAVAVLLVVTSERARSSASGVVLTAMILSGVGLVFALVSLIAGFMLGSELNRVSVGFAHLVEVLSLAAVLGIFAFVLLKVFNDPTLVPRATPQQQVYGGYPQAGAQPQAYAQPGYQDPSVTGGQPAADPAQAVPGQQAAYTTGAQQAYDPNQYGQAQQGYDASGQAQGYDAAQAQQQAYDPGQYGQTQQYTTGAQQAYDPNQYGQAQQGYDASGQAQPQAAYGTDPAQAQQQAYDPNQYGQAQQYGTGAQAQQGYGQSYDPSQYAPQGDQAGAASGEQAAQDAINYGWYQGQGQAQPAQSESGVEPFFNSGENNGTETTDQGGSTYGDQYGSTPGYGSDQQGQGGTGGQQGWYGGEGQR